MCVCVGGGGFVLGVVLGDVVDVAAWGIVPCVSKIYTLGDGGGGFVLWVCLVETWTVVKTILNTS